MKKLFQEFVLALAVLASLNFAGLQVAMANQLVINSYIYGAGGAPSVSITFLGCTVDDTNATTYTYTSVNTGTAGSRTTIIGITGEDGANTFGVNSVTVGGDSATEVVDEGGSVNSNNTAIYAMSNPADTSETIAVTWSEAIESSTICVWDAQNLSSSTATDTAVGVGSGAIALTIDTITNGVTVGQCTSRDALTGFAWAQLTEEVDATTAETGYSSADLLEDSAVTGLAVTCNPSGSASGSAAAASFQ